jgi:hypothetical protein
MSTFGYKRTFMGAGLKVGFTGEPVLTYRKLKYFHL